VELDLGSLAPPPPEDLLTLADYVRAAGGWAFVGGIGTATEASAERVRALEDVWVEYPRDQAVVETRDSLGGSMDDRQTVLAPSAEGLPRATDADGAPANVVVSGTWDPGPHRSLQPSGDAVLFVAQLGAERMMIWRAELVDGTHAGGDGTISGSDIPLSELRLAE
jgi:hypothetical protein